MLMRDEFGPVMFSGLLGFYLLSMFSGLLGFYLASPFLQSLFHLHYTHSYSSTFFNTHTHSSYRSATMAEELPHSFSWVDRGLLNPVRDQIGKTCWAFATIASIEAAHQLQTGNRVELSEQYLIDCDNNFNENGLWGGSVHKAFRFIMSGEGRLYGRDVYEFTGENRYCLLDDGPLNSAAAINGYGRVLPRRNDEAIRLAVLRQPVTAVMEAWRGRC